MKQLKKFPVINILGIMCKKNRFELVMKLAKERLPQSCAWRKEDEFHLTAIMIIAQLLNIYQDTISQKQICDLCTDYCSGRRLCSTSLLTSDVINKSPC